MQFKEQVVICFCCLLLGLPWKELIFFFLVVVVLAGEIDTMEERQLITELK